MITKRQKQLLEIIYNFIKDTGYPPTFEEMREGVNVVSNQSILDLLNKLKKQKFLKRNESSARGLTILPLGYKFLEKDQSMRSRLCHKKIDKRFFRQRVVRKWGILRCCPPQFQESFHRFAV